MGYSLEDIEKMEDDEIKDIVLELNKSQIEYIKESSLLNIIVSLEAIDKLIEEKEVENQNCQGEIDKIYEIIASYKASLKNWNFEEISLSRSELLDLRHIVEGYIIELGYVGELVDENGTKILSKENKTSYQTNNVDQLIHEINHALEDAQADYGKYAFIVGEIVRVLPIRIVKKNYVDILGQTLARNMANFNQTLVDSHMEAYKKRFDSSTRHGYGTKFDYYFMQIEKIKRENLEDKDINQLSDLVKIIIDLTSELNQLQDFIISLGIVANLFIVLDKTREINIGEQDLILDFIALEDQDKDDYIQGLESRLNNIEKDLQLSLEDYEKFAIELANREDFNHDLLEDDLVYTRNILAYYNDVNFSDEQFINSMDVEVANQDYIQNSIDSLVEYMDRATIGMNNLERKIRMRKLLSIIDLPFNHIKDFENYVRYSLDSRLLNEDIINFKINQIHYFLNEIKNK